MKHLVLIALLIPICASAQVYEWIDENGKKQFSDQPPPGIDSKSKNYELHNIDSNMPAPIVVDKERDRRKAQKTAARKEHMKAACKEAKNYLAAIKGRVAFVDESGGDVRVSEKERAKMYEKLHADIRKYC